MVKEYSDLSFRKLHSLIKFKKFFIIFILTMLLLTTGISNTLIADQIKNEDSKEKTEKPKIIFEEQIYDFGKIYTGEIVEYQFKFKNSGAGELVIKDVKSSCGCTAALVSKNTLQKNEEGEVKVKFNAGQYVGKVTKSVVVNSNDPDNPTCRLSITGEIIEEVSVNPKRINFGIIRKGDSSTRTVEIKTVPELKLEVKKVESPSPYIVINQLKNDEDNISRFEITVAKYDYLGKFYGMVFVYTSSNKQERIDIPFSGEVVGDVTYYPEILSFGNINRNQDVKRVVIVNILNKDVKIEKIEAEHSPINYELYELNNSSKKIDIKLNKNITIGKITGSLKIYTNSAIQPIISIPIQGEVKG